MNNSLEEVLVIGFGRLGYPLATCFAAKGFDVIGIVLNPHIVETVNLGQSPA
jgi:UDPglucose 6-dehydrogenase